MTKLSAVPGLVLDWVPVWIALRCESDEEQFGRVADHEGSWGYPVSVQLDQNIDLRTFKSQQPLLQGTELSPVIVRSIIVSIAVFSSLKLLDSELPTLVLPNSSLWCVLVAVAVGLVQASVEIYVKLQAHFQVLYPDPRARRDELIRLYTARRSGWCRLRTRGRSLPIFALALGLFTSAAVGAAKERAAGTSRVESVARGHTLQSLQHKALVHQWVTDGVDGESYTWQIAFLGGATPNPSWICVDLDDRRREVGVEWRVTFPSDVEKLRVPSENSAWEVTERGAVEREVLGLDGKPFARRKQLDHVEFRTRSDVPFGRPPPLLKLKFKSTNIDELQLLAGRELAVAVIANVACDVEVSAPWYLGGEINFPFAAELEGQDD